MELYPVAFRETQEPTAAEESATGEAPAKMQFVVNDALTNPDYIRFAIKGTLAAMVCYIIYSAVAWPGISTAVLTCFLTGLSTIGASKQKQFNRLMGSLVGGALGIAALAFLVPLTDSITSISLLIAAGTLLSAWFFTASPRISYFGLQTALGFYLTLLVQDYGVTISLVPPRDRLIGVLLGVVVMGFVFDQLWPTSAANEMRKEFEKTLRRMGTFAGLIAAEHRTAAELKLAALRETINTGFSNVHTHADSIKFEFGAGRAANLALRERILHWQSVARTLYLLELGLGRHLSLRSLAELPAGLREAQEKFCDTAGETLEFIAARVEGTAPKGMRPDLHGALAGLVKESALWFASRPVEHLSARVSGVIATAREFVVIAEGLSGEMGAGEVGS